MNTEINILAKVKLKDPILIQGLPGVGNVGRISAGYLVNELKMEKFAELYSPKFLPLVIIHDSMTHTLKCEFYYKKGKKNDIVILTGDSQSVTPKGHYEFCDTVLEFAEKLGVKTVITLGGFAEGKMIKKPKVIGAVNKKSLISDLEKHGVDFTDHSVGTILGASGLLVGLAERHKMDGICLMGQTMGYPMITDPKAADSVLHVLSKMLGIKVDLTRIENIVKEMDEKLRKTEALYRKMSEEAQKSSSDDVKYIG